MTRRITPRQAEVAALLSVGLRNKEIATKLGVGPHTIKNHVYDIGTRIGVRGRAAIAAWWAVQAIEDARDEGYARGYRHGYVDGSASVRPQNVRDTSRLVHDYRQRTDPNDETGSISIQEDGKEVKLSQNSSTASRRIRVNPGRG